jgi:predicted transposase YdaD
MKEYDDYVVLKDAMNVKYQEGAEKGEQRGEQRGFKKGMAEGIAKGMAQGKAEGERDANIATARQMKADGMAIALIIKYTGLTAEEIDKL